MMDWILIGKVIKKLIALGIFIWLIYTFSSEAKKRKRSRPGWVMIGLASFYGSYFISAFCIFGAQLLLASFAAGGFNNIDKTAIPGMVASSIVYAVPFALGVAVLVRKKLRGLSEPPAFQSSQEHPSHSPSGPR